MNKSNTEAPALWVMAKFLFAWMLNHVMVWLNTISEAITPLGIMRTNLFVSSQILPSNLDTHRFLCWVVLSPMKQLRTGQSCPLFRLRPWPWSPGCDRCGWAPSGYSPRALHWNQAGAWLLSRPFSEKYILLPSDFVGGWLPGNFSPSFFAKFLIFLDQYLHTR